MKVARLLGVDDGSFIEVDLALLQLFSIKLSPGDVARNQGDLGMCEECGVRKGPSELRSCEGAFPYCVGFAFPPQALARQHKCLRAAICGSCLRKPEGAERLKRWKFVKQKTYLCSLCSAGPTRLEDCWGEQITEAPFRLAA